MGFVKDVANLLAVIDIGILCSEREALPLTLLEYMASGKPIVATNIGGVPEVVQEGVNGYLVQTGDYHALAQRINSLLADRDLAARMGENGRSIVKQRFTEQTMMQQIENLYAQTLAFKRSVQV
jgi:glycosyltransferase involved in cell wall biosynthesis